MTGTAGSWAKRAVELGLAPAGAPGFVDRTGWAWVAAGAVTLTGAGAEDQRAGAPCLCLLTRVPRGAHDAALRAWIAAGQQDQPAKRRRVVVRWGQLAEGVLVAEGEVWLAEAVVVRAQGGWGACLFAELDILGTVAAEAAP
jgi:hypothetical protein